MGGIALDSDVALLDPTACLARGRHHYRQKQYAEAIAAFTKAKDCTAVYMRLTALDYRAAAYEKTSELGRALHDAREMIALNPKAAKGYLRCGKVLMVKGKLDAALQVYELGLKKIKIGEDADRQLLQGMHQKLLSKQPATKSYNPLELLPMEICEFMCFHLSTRELLNCLAVCKSWKRYLESMPRLWRRIDLTNSRKISQRALRAHLRRSNFTVEELESSWSPSGLDAAKLAMVSSTCRTLVTFRLKGIFQTPGPDARTIMDAVMSFKSLRHLELDHCVTLLDFHRLIDRHPTLECAKFVAPQGRRLQPMEIPFPPVPKLHTLELYFNGEILTWHTYDLVEVCRQAPQLRVLHLENTRVANIAAAGKFEELRLPWCQIYVDGRWEVPASLRVLDLSYASENGESEGVATDPTGSLPLLEVLKLNCFAAAGLRAERFIHAASAAETLRVLELAQELCHRELIDQFVREWFVPCASLHELSLAGIRLDDDGLAEITSCYPNLRRLNCAHNHKMTGCGVKRILQNCPRLEVLGLEDCSHVFYDAIELARRQGVYVRLSDPSKTKGRFVDRAFMS